MTSFGQLIAVLGSARRPLDDVLPRSCLAAWQATAGVGATLSGGSWDAGGGVSALFGKPAFQDSALTGSSAHRTVADIGMQVGGCPTSIATQPCDGGDDAIDGAGNSEPSFVHVMVQGEFVGLIGTSVSSPELAGATALLIERYGRMGNLNT